MNRKCLLFLLAALTLIGCGRYFTPDINLKRRLDDADLIGTWVLTADTLKIAARDGYAPAAEAVHRLVLRPNGQCHFASIVEFAGKSTHLEGDGTWRLVHDTEFRGDPRGRKNRLELVVDTGRERRGITFDLTEEDGKLLLWAFWGDPDSWEFMHYEKAGRLDP